MILREKIKDDEKLQSEVLACYTIISAALRDEFEEMLEIDSADKEIFEKIVVDTCNYLKTKVKKSIKNTK